MFVRLQVLFTSMEAHKDYCNSHVYSKGLKILDGSKPPDIMPSKSSAIDISGALLDPGMVDAVLLLLRKFQWTFNFLTQ